VYCRHGTGWGEVRETGVGRREKGVVIFNVVCPLGQELVTRIMCLRVSPSSRKASGSFPTRSYGTCFSQHEACPKPWVVFGSEISGGGAQGQDREGWVRRKEMNRNSILRSHPLTPGRLATWTRSWSLCSGVEQSKQNTKV
jgi:hypothetical protein